MRTKDEILRDAQEIEGNDYGNAGYNLNDRQATAQALVLVLEVLLDLRDLAVENIGAKK